MVRSRSAVARLGFVAALVIPPSLDAQQPAVIGPVDRYADVSRALTAFIEREMRDKGIPALSIALVDGPTVVWSRGFGVEHADGNVPATANTVYRVGSVSKLFTDIALMQLVERGEVDLDTPVKTYLPDFDPKNASGKPITLRQMMAHKSGLTREPAVGHYFDPTSPTLAATVASLNHSELVHDPETKTKYSNAAIAVVGQVVATLCKDEFETTVKKTVLDPLGMTRTDFRLTPELSPLLAKAQMWTYDGRTFEAPTFALGTSSAGNLYSTVNDMGRFLVALMNDGKGQGGSILKPETLRAMRQVQFASPEANAGFGLGFAVSNFEGNVRIGHGGAVYGFATEVAALPYAKLGVAVVATRDCANAIVGRIANDALRLLLATSMHQPLREIVISEAIQPAMGRLEAGVSPSVVYRRNGLWMIPNRDAGGSWDELRLVDTPGDVASPRHKSFDGSFRVDLATKVQLPIDLPSPVPTAAPKSFDGLIGEYGWDHNVLYVYERDGKLWTLIEWFFDYPLTHIDGDHYTYGSSGLYEGERADFTRDASGRATEVRIGDVVFKRRPIAGEDGKTFKITPVRPVAELRAEALAAKPPIENKTFRKSDLVDLTTLDPTIKLDIRYATDNNFAGTPFYSSSRAFMQKPAAEALVRANKALAPAGLGLLIHDAYRPWYVTKMFWEATPEVSRGFVADPAKGSRHNRGCAVDLTLYHRKTGAPIQMVGGYDEFSDRSNPDYPGGTSRQRWYRDRLRRAMEDEGFAVFDIEWWHFDYRDWTKYPILNATFEEMAR